MKTSVHSDRGATRGSAVIVVMTILAILIIYSIGNVRTLDYLGSSLRLLEKNQQRHWSETAIVRESP